jgi:hypothetical protein
LQTKLFFVYKKWYSGSKIRLKNIKKISSHDKLVTILIRTEPS